MLEFLGETSLGTHVYVEKETKNNETKNNETKNKLMEYILSAIAKSWNKKHQQNNPMDAELVLTIAENIYNLVIKCGRMHPTTFIKFIESKDNIEKITNKDLPNKIKRASFEELKELINQIKEETWRDRSIKEPLL